MTPHPDIAAVLSGERRWAVVTADCLSILPTIPAGSVGAVVVDPPYSSGGAFRSDRMASTRSKYQQSDVVTEFASFSGDNRDQRGFSYWVALWLSACGHLCVPGGMLCQFTDWRQLPTTTDAIQAGGWVWRGIVPWDKVVARPQANRFRAQCEYMVWGTNGPREFSPDEASAYGDGVLRVATTPTNDREHSTQKPAELMAQIIEVAAPPGSIILDPFAGSGTTGVACMMTGRRFIGIEIEGRYADIARRRIAEAANTLWTPEPAQDPDPALFGE